MTVIQQLPDNTDHPSMPPGAHCRCALQGQIIFIPINNLHVYRFIFYNGNVKKKKNFFVFFTKSTVVLSIRIGGPNTFLQKNTHVSEDRASVFSDVSIYPTPTPPSSCRRISLSAVKWLRSTGYRKAAGDRCWRDFANWWRCRYAESLRGDEVLVIGEQDPVPQQPPAPRSLTAPVGPFNIYLSQLPRASPTLAATCCCFKNLSCYPLFSVAILYSLTSVSALFIFFLSSSSFWPPGVVLWMQQLLVFSILNLSSVVPANVDLPSPLVYLEHVGARFACEFQKLGNYRFEWRKLLEWEGRFHSCCLFTDNKL